VAAHGYKIHKRYIYKGDTIPHAEGTDPRGGLARASEGQDTYH